MAPRAPPRPKPTTTTTTSPNTTTTPRPPHADKNRVEKTTTTKTKTPASASASAGAGAGAGVDKPSTKPKGEKKATEKVEKVRAVNGEEASELILGYLKVQNRPYSATEVSANLRGKVTKTVADKILKELGEKKRVGMNSTNQDKKGSQFVFWTVQDPADAASPEELSGMDTTINSLRAGIPGLKSRLKTATSRLATLKAAPTTAELQGIVERLGRESAVIAEKLRGFKSGEVKQVSREEMDRVEREYKYWSLKRKARKQAFLGLEDILLGGMTREEIWERAGIEGEED